MSAIFFQERFHCQAGRADVEGQYSEERGILRARISREAQGLIETDGMTVPTAFHATTQRFQMARYDVVDEYPCQPWRQLPLSGSQLRSTGQEMVSRKVLKPASSRVLWGLGLPQDRGLRCAPHNQTRQNLELPIITGRSVIADISQKRAFAILVTTRNMHAVLLTTTNESSDGLGEVVDLDWAWTWSGRCFGYWDGADLWTYKGKHVGRRQGSEVYGPDGRYLGDVMSNHRLVIIKAKAGQQANKFYPQPIREPQQRRPDLDNLSLYTGYEDFISPEAF